MKKPGIGLLIGLAKAKKDEGEDGAETPVKAGNPTLELAGRKALKALKADDAAGFAAAIKSIVEYCQEGPEEEEEDLDMEDDDDEEDDDVA
jgi:hypothetical protein